MAAPDHEGQTTTCKGCGRELIAAWKKYEGFEDKLQWQNPEDGTAHYKFAGPGKFKCSIPKSDEEKKEETMDIPPQSNNNTQKTLGEALLERTSTYKTMKDDIDVLNEKIDAHTKMLNEIIRLLADMKLSQMDNRQEDIKFPCFLCDQAYNSEVELQHHLRGIHEAK